MEEEVFLKLIKEHAGLIHKICRLYRDRLEDREDLFQEIVFQLWKSVSGFRGEAKPSTWIYRVALHTAIASFRKKQLPVTYTDALPDLPSPGSGEKITEQQELLYAALRQLNDGEKALMLLFFEDLSYREIAAVSGITESNVGVKLNRIKKKLQHLINKMT